MITLEDDYTLDKFREFILDWYSTFINSSSEIGAKSANSYDKKLTLMRLSWYTESFMKFMMIFKSLSMHHNYLLLLTIHITGTSLHTIISQLPFSSLACHSPAKNPS